MYDHVNKIFLFIFVYHPKTIELTLFVVVVLLLFWKRQVPSPVGIDFLALYLLNFFTGVSSQLKSIELFFKGLSLPRTHDFFISYFDTGI